MHQFSARERKYLRSLANVALERSLLAELKRLRLKFDALESGEKDAFELTQDIDKFSHGPSRRLFQQFADNNTFFGVCGAYRDGVLTDDDLTDASERVRAAILKVAQP